MMPVTGETPQIDWPVITIGNQRLIIRWTFYAQWLLSKRKVDVKTLPTLMELKDPTLVDTMVECFAAAVAENFTVRNMPAPTAEQWALTISQDPDPKLWGSINVKLWDAVGKARPAGVALAPRGPATQEPTTTQ